MNPGKSILAIITGITLAAAIFFTGCGDDDDSPGYFIPLIVDQQEIANPELPNPEGVPEEPEEPENPWIPDDPIDDPPIFNGGAHSIFDTPLGVRISQSAIGILDPDPTGHNPSTDFDGDGIANGDEIASNEYVSDYPRIVTRISAPITMEIRVEETEEVVSFAETLEDSNVQNTITNSMEDRQYDQENLKTTPYVSREMHESGSGKSFDFSYNKTGSSTEIESGHSLKDLPNTFGLPMNGSYFESTGSEDDGPYYEFYQQSNTLASDWRKETGTSKEQHYNKSTSDYFSRMDMSEKTVFEDVKYVDNLNRQGLAFTSDSVEQLTTKYRKYEKENNVSKIGKDAGYVRTALFIKNMTVNMPVMVSNILCTLSFRTYLLPISS